MRKPKVAIRAVKEVIDGEVFYICNKCGKQLPENCFYGRNRICKHCYHPTKKKETRWHCKYCGETNELKRHRKYLFCKTCAKTRYLPKGVQFWQCRECGDLDISHRSAMSMVCKICAAKKSSQDYWKKKGSIKGNPSSGFKIVAEHIEIKEI